jgi:formylglycine-generating enzyme required for sulfatase activity/streptogramin lyase
MKPSLSILWALLGAAAGCQNVPAPPRDPSLSATPSASDVSAAVALQPVDVAVDDRGALFVADAASSRVLKVDGVTGALFVVASGGAGKGFRTPRRIALDGRRHLYIADASSHRVARVELATGAVSPFAGDGSPGFAGDDRPARHARLSHPGGLAIDRSANLWFADTGNSRVRRVDAATGVISTVFDGTAASPRDENALPADIAFDAAGNLFIVDPGLGLISRREATSGVITQVKETDPKTYPDSDPARVGRVGSRRRVAVDPRGALYLIEAAAHRILRVPPGGGQAERVAGNGRSGFAGDGGPAEEAQLSWPAAIAIGPAGDLFIADSGNGRIRRVDAATGVITTVLGGGGASPGPRGEALQSLEIRPDPSIVTDAGVRSRIEATGLPWRVRHRATGIELLLVPAGSYTRGAGPDEVDHRGDAGPAHRVSLSRPFYVGRYEVTNDQYRRHDPTHVSLLSPTDHFGSTVDGLSFDGGDQPAVNLSWYDADEFCRRFGLRLPTEAQWEYAARAGSTAPYAWGAARSDAQGWANVANPSMAEHIRREFNPFPFEDGYFLTAPVGRFRANAFGLHDMIGNAWEWVSDWYADKEYARYPDGVTDPQGPDQGTARVLRGSSWRSPFEGDARLSFRARTRPAAAWALYRGLRVVLLP